MTRIAGLVYASIFLALCGVVLAEAMGVGGADVGAVGSGRSGVGGPLRLRRSHGRPQLI